MYLTNSSHLDNIKKVTDLNNSDIQICKRFMRPNVDTGDKTKSIKSVSPNWFECLNNCYQCEKSINFNRRIVINVISLNDSVHSEQLKNRKKTFKRIYHIKVNIIKWVGPTFQHLLLL